MVSTTNYLNIFLYKNKEIKKINIDNSIIYITDHCKPKIQYGYNHYIDKKKENFKKLINENTNIKYDIINDFSIDTIVDNNTIDDDINSVINTDKKKQKKKYNDKFYVYFELFNVFEDIFISDTNNITLLCNDDIINSLYIFCANKKITFDVKKEKKSNIIIIHKDDKIDHCSKNIESLYLKSLINNMIIILTNQINNGTCILNIIENYTEPTIKILYLLSLLYEEFYIYKPSYLKVYYSDKIIVCKKYKYNNTDKNIKELISLLKIIFDSKKNIEDFLVKETISYEFKYFIKYTNHKLMNLQYKYLNEIIEYITNKDFFGKKYHDCKNKQMDNYLWWKKYFITNNKESIKTIYNESIQINTNEFNKFIDNMYNYF